MVIGYKQIAMPQIFKIIPAKEGRKTNGNQACYLELAEVGKSSSLRLVTFLLVASVCSILQFLENFGVLVHIELCSSCI